MNDLRTKVTDLPLLEDKEQVDTVLALGKDGKMYRIDGSDIGKGDNLTPIKCRYESYGDYCELNIEDADLIDNLLKTGGVIHIFVAYGRFSFEDIKLNLAQTPTSPDSPQAVNPQSLSALSYKPDGNYLLYDDTFIGISFTQVDLNSVLVLELCDNSKYTEPSVLETSYKYSLKFYMVEISDIQEALEELSKESVNKNLDCLRNYDSPNDIVYGHFITSEVGSDKILNVFIENKPALNQPRLIIAEEES